MQKKIQIIIIINLLLISSNFVGITTANNPLKDQSLKTLAYYPESHDFGDMKKDEINSTTFEIWNAGCCYLYFDLHENEEWIEVNPIEGGSTGDHVIITVAVNTTNLTLGLHKGIISIHSNGGEGNFTITVKVISDNPVIDISVSEAWNLLSDTSNGIQIPIDIRTEEEWKTEHIDTPSPENPIHNNYLEWSDPNILQEFMSTYEGKELIIYCGVDGRSKMAANILAENNFNGIIYNMLGGLKEWKNKGYLTDGYTTFEIINFQGGFGTISVDIKNNGTFTAKNITIEIKVVGGFLSGIDFTSSCLNCPVPLAPNATETESTRKDGFIIGFGPIEITASAMAGNAEKITIKQEGYIFGLLVLIR